jgi:hypothetical protein
VAAAVAAIGVAAGVASADKVKLNGGPGYGGGSFVGTITREVSGIGLNPAPFSPFGGTEGSTLTTRTFCSETGEYFTPGVTYYAEYATSAMNGGVGGGGDPISTQSAWLVSRAIGSPSALNAIFGGAFNIDNANHSRAVQEALWKMEGETYAFAGGTIGAWREALISLAGSNADGSLYGVMLMRMWDNRSYNAVSGNWVYSGNRQDQFVMIPLPPAAWAGFGTIAAVIGFGYIRRRSLRQD